MAPKNRVKGGEGEKPTSPIDDAQEDEYDVGKDEERQVTLHVAAAKLGNVGPLGKGLRMA